MTHPTVWLDDHARMPADMYDGADAARRAAIRRHPEDTDAVRAKRLAAHTRVRADWRADR